MNSPFFTALLVCCFTAPLVPALAAPEEKALPVPISLNEFLETKRVASNLPAVAAAVVRGGAIVAEGAVGFRCGGAPEKVTLEDKWHIGSCTKSMTATLAAMLVEDGTLRWNMTLAEGLPKLAAQMRPDWRKVTIEQLLAHRGGAPHDLKAKGLQSRLWDNAAQPPRQQRAYLATELLTKHEPAVPIGERFDYSNAGYALVGHVIEEKLNKPFEEILTEKLFLPLKMTTAGFGAPAKISDKAVSTTAHRRSFAPSLANPDQPLGHIQLKEHKFFPRPPGLEADNPAAIGPGGTVHCSIGDLARYANFHLRGARRGDALLKREGFRTLHTPFATDGDYALGWSVLRRDWGGGEVLTHNGTNTMNYAVMWLAPRRDFAVVAVTNCYGDGVAGIIDDIVGKLVRDYAPLTDAP